MLGRRLRTDRHSYPLEDMRGWLFSEKYDGIRCYYDGKGSLWSRSGRKIKAPRWFIKKLPRRRLDGELFAGYGVRPRTVGIVRNVNNKWWPKIKYMVFDQPSRAGEPFAVRIRKLPAKHPVYPVTHKPVTSTAQLHSAFKRVIARGGEGLVLREPASRYYHGRSPMFRKYKPYGVD